MADALEIQDAPLKKQRGRKPQSQEEESDVLTLDEPKELTKEQKALSQKFDPNKKYMFELAAKNIERELPVINMQTKRPIRQPEYNQYRNIVYTSQIVWNGDRRMLRYYDGCTSIFVDEQPKDKDTIDQLIKQTKKRAFLEGKFGCFGDERMLLLYLNICSWNAKSDFRTRSADMVFVSTNKDEVISIESTKLDNQEKALNLAKTATETKMMIHANYLQIPFFDYDSGNELTPKEIRVEYRKKALSEPDLFIESYGNKKIEIKYYIDKALEKGLINNKINPNKAMLGNIVVCDISGLRTQEAIAAKLFEFSSMEEGEEFVIQLKALFN